ncbi:N-acetylneuraminate synthase [Cohnella sp. JJ-181]|uniref:N-acetylneuraminate synthase n=1 Tax=Cohnella rhizoplanae TaxID=2974897 RepID=UPI0022FF57AF|nr:N-acetylneuraminate synthase [Cohnella sp. JJ-181]CAI6084360.1 N,N'-diacetyllegionaminic acid synthase [Cohnella sp. JJ-181]
MTKENQAYIIAEAGVNHNGSLELAMDLIRAAADAGADAVKFQTFKADLLVTRTADRAAYQDRNTGDADTQYEMIRKLELSEADHLSLKAECAVRGIAFLSSPFDLASLRLLVEDVGVDRLKIPSGEITNAPLLLNAARSGLPIILSSGVCTMADIESALAWIAFGYRNEDGIPTEGAVMEAYASPEGQRLLREKVTLLHCTTEYPAPFDEVNLRVMDTFATAFGLSVGYSDHTQGIAIPIAAVARGATVIEKHFTLSRGLPGPDHQASLEPNELQAMVAAIRQVEQALGSAVKKPSRSESLNRNVIRKSLVAATDIRKGERFTVDNIGIKRPGGGLAPNRYWDLLGRKALRDYAADEGLFDE